MRDRDNPFIRYAMPTGVIAVSAFMLLAAWMFYRQSDIEVRARDWMVHSYEVRSHIQQLSDKLKDAQIGQRGYLLTGNPDYLAPYRQAIMDSSEAGPNMDELGQHFSIAQELGLLHRLTADNPQQQRRTEELDIAAKSLLDYLAASIGLQQSQGAEAARQAFDMQREEQAADHVRSLISAMAMKENRLLARRSEADEAGMLHNSILIFCGLALFYAVITGALLLASRHARHARRLEREALEAGRKLADSRAFLKNIINHVPDPIFVKDARHRWIDGNTALWALFGKGEAELLGKSDYDFFPKEEADIFWAKDQEVFASGKENSNIENFTDAAGKTHIISTRKACFRNAASEPILVGVIRDITELTQAQDKLKQSDEARIKSIMDHSGRLLAIKDLDGKYLQVNQPMLDMLERGNEEVIGKTDYDLFIREYADIYRQNDLAVIASATAIDYEETIPHQDGLHIYRMVKFPLYDMAERMYAICGLSADVTEQKKSEEAKRLLAAIVESSDDAIFSKTLGGVINAWNAGAERMFGYSAAEIVGKHIGLLVPPERMEEERNILAELRAGHAVTHYETVRTGKDGRRIDVSLSVSPIYDASGRIIAASNISRDISGRKAVEAQLLRYTHELERSNQELDDFAYIASHDLKEPLRGLYNHASFLLEDYADKLDEEGVRRLGRLSHLSQRMERLVSDLLYFSRLGRSELAIQDSDPNAMIADIRQMMESFLHEHNARIVMPEPMPPVVCDQPRITEVFRNLITNAVKYNDSKEKIIEVGFKETVEAPHGAEKNVFYVKDNGIGIDPEFHEQIFRIFKRLNPASDKETGTGAGLTFVKKIIERHKGHVWLESRPKSGSTFYFTVGKINL